MLRRAGDDGAESRGFATALVCISTYMIITGIVFAPRRRALSWSALGAVVVFPIVWLAYTLIRGPLVHDFRTGNDWWYPYPFLNPNVQPWGYVGVALYSIGIAVAIVAVGAFTVWVGQRRGSATSPRR